MNKKNKKGDLPVTILVIGVFGVCTLALLTFVYSSFQIHKSLIGVEIMEKANVQIESHNLNHIYLYKKVTKLAPEWGFHWLKDKIIFSVEYNPP
ncbi:MAG: hypothetical protein NTZ83_02830 [Candidatus Pacearchaeota archaeon]|nr:hypothetical protein [Candidatus Pacearchaeota archaeon]